MNNEAWKELFKKALKQLAEAKIPKFKWSFGGGTVLNHIYGHRESKDIDIFFRDRQLLGFVSPRLNDANVADLNLYIDMDNFVKLYFPEGEVDFIYSPQVTDFKPKMEKILGQNVYIDHPVEIVAKKIKYRSESFTAKDFFDLAIVQTHMPEELIKVVPYCLEEKEKIENRLKSLQKDNLLEKYFQSMAIKTNGQIVRGKEENICLEFIKSFGTKKRELERKNKSNSRRRM